MTITIQGSNTATDAGSGTFTLDMSGTGVAQDDVMYVWVTNVSGTAPALTTTGFTNLFNSTNGTNKSGLFRKVQGVSPDTSVVITGPGVRCDVVGIVARGVDTSTPEDAALTSASGTSVNPDSPGITTVTDNAMVMSLASSTVSDTAVTDPSGYTRINGIGTPGALSAYASQLIKTPAGAEDPGSWTNWSSGDWFALSVALRPKISPGASVAWLRV